jgi:hypothetical protein
VAGERDRSLEECAAAMVTAVGSTDVVERGYSLIDEIRALTPERGAEEVPFEPDGLTGDGRVGYKTTTPARSTLGPTRPV